MKIDIIDNDGNIKNVLDEENNFIDKNRIKILHKKFFNLKFYYFYLGNTLNFYFPFTTNIFHNNKNLNPPFSLNKNFMLPILLILILILYFCLLYYIIIIHFLKITKYNYIFLLIAFIGTFFAFLVIIINPGIIINSNENIKNSKYCNICKIYIPKGKNNYHCKKCNVCLINIDHHCEIFGKCITMKILFYFFGCLIIGGILNTIFLFCFFKLIYNYYK